MPSIPQQTFDVNPLQAARNHHLLTTIAVRLPAGINYPRGTALGEVTSPLRNEVHTITPGGGTGGAYAFLYQNGAQTPDIAFNANGAAIQAALNAALGVNAVTVTGGSPFVVTYTGPEHKSREIAPPQVISSITGGSSPSIAETTAGNAFPVGCYAKELAGASDGRQSPTVLLVVATKTDSRGCIVDQFGASNSVDVGACNGGEFYVSDIPNASAAVVTSLGKLVSGSAWNSPGAIVKIF